MEKPDGPWPITPPPTTASNNGQVTQKQYEELQKRYEDLTRKVSHTRESIQALAEKLDQLADGAGKKSMSAAYCFYKGGSVIGELYAWVIEQALSQQQPINADHIEKFGDTLILYAKGMMEMVRIEPTVEGPEYLVELAENGQDD